MKKLILAVILVTVVIVVAPIIKAFLSGQKPDENLLAMLPWNVQVLPDGRNRVFGLIPGESTLTDARDAFGPDMDTAIVAPKDRAPLLEAYLEAVTAGFVTGKLVLTVDLPEETLIEMRDRALKEEYMESVTRKIRLHPDDLRLARLTPIRVITFMPSARLDENIILERFGAPSARVLQENGTENFQYPEKGMDIALGKRGKAIIQYVTPSLFDLLDVSHLAENEE